MAGVFEQALDQPQEPLNRAVYKAVVHFLITLSLPIKSLSVCGIEKMVILNGIPYLGRKEAEFIVAYEAGSKGLFRRWNNP